MTAQGKCNTQHDWFTAMLTFGLCCGLIISYAPQHYRIIHKRTSLGLSPWFLLLGSTSTAASMFNMVIMQWEILKCCRVVPLGYCVELSAGVIQVGLQWLLFTMILVLYMKYYPQELRYELETYDSRTSYQQTPRKRDEWRTSIVLAWIVAVHFFVILATTVYILTKPLFPVDPVLALWAMFLGVSSAVLAAVQYAPQLTYTFNIKLVGALSIPMMLIQTPGAVLMVLSIVLRPGTDWTSWITFAVAGVMQGSLLTMCLAWKVRQRRLGVDDFGQKTGLGEIASTEVIVSEETPLLRSG